MARQGVAGQVRHEADWSSMDGNGQARQEWKGKAMTGKAGYGMAKQSRKGKHNDG